MLVPYAYMYTFTLTYVVGGKIPELGSYSYEEDQRILGLFGFPLDKDTMVATDGISSGDGEPSSSTSEVEKE